MNNRKIYSAYLAFAALLLASLACQAVQGGAPTSIPGDSTSTEQANPIAPTSSPITENVPPAQTGGAYEGSWTGPSSNNYDFKFDVSGNQVTWITLSYADTNNGCSMSGVIDRAIESSPITDGSFSAEFTSNEGIRFEVAGSFESDSKASGTAQIKGPLSGGCSDFQTDMNWTASKDSAVNIEPTASEVASGGTEVDSIALVNQFFDAVNAGDADSAVALVDKNIMVSIDSKTLFDSGELKAYFESSQGTTYEISDAQSFSSAIVKFKAKSSDGTVYSTCQAFVHDGKITMLSLMP